jgi:hypothetical protein
MEYPRTPAITTSLHRRWGPRTAFARASVVALGLIGPFCLTAQTVSATTPLERGVTETAANSQVLVTFGLGWTVANSSTSTTLVMVGPQELSALFFATAEKTSVTLAEMLRVDLASRQKVAPGAKVCSPPKSEKVPGSPVVLGEGELICFSTKSQSGAGNDWLDLDTVGLANVKGGKLRLEVDAVFPASTTSATLENTLIPLVFSAKWKGLKSV